MFEFDWNDPLAQVFPGETTKAIRAFRDYVNMGLGRSLQKLADHYVKLSTDGQDVPTVHRAVLSTWSAEHRWQERLARFDQMEHERAEQLRIEADRAAAEEARKHRRQALDALWAKMTEALAKARLIDKEGNLVDGVRAADLIKGIQAFLSESRTEYEGVPVSRSVTFNVDYSSLTKEQLQRIAAGEPINEVLE